MTLDFESHSLAVSFHRLSISALAVLAFVLLVSNRVAADAINSDHEVRTRLCSDAGCLFIEDDWSEGRPESNRSTSQRRPTSTTNQHDYDVFPLESSIADIAQKIVTGMVNSIQTETGQNRFGDSMVDLSVFVGQRVERSNIQEDPYWNYYLSCDTWDVAFNAEPDFSRNEPTIDSEQDFDQSTVRQHLIQNLKQIYLYLEFAFIEQMNCESITLANESNLFDGLQYLSSNWSASDWFNVKQVGLFGLWDHLHHRFEQASRLIFHLRYASKIGDQFLDSSLQNIH